MLLTRPHKLQRGKIIMMISDDRYAYIEFESLEGAMRARLLNESLFHGRQITVLPKRKNIPGSGTRQNAGLQNLMLPLL